MPTTEPIRAVGYVRVSTTNDAQATSPAVQRAMIEEECARHGWELLCVFEDRKSGESLDRPDFAELRSFIAVHPEGVHKMVVKDLSRFGRETVDYLTFTRNVLTPRGIDLHVVNGINGEGKGVELTRLIEMWMAEDWRLENKRKIRDANRVHASQGHWTGIIPYGYYSSKRDDPREGCVLRVREDQAAVVRRIYSLLAAGSGTRGISRLLNIEGVPSAAGGRWCNASIRRILRNGVYAGYINYRGEQLPGAHDPIVPLELWESLQLAIGPQRAPRVAGNYLLRRVRCEHWGQRRGGLLPMYGLTRKGLRRYALSQRSPGREISAMPLDDLAERFPREIDADALEDLVVSAFLAAVPPGDQPETAPAWWVEIRERSEDELRGAWTALAERKREATACRTTRALEQLRLDRALEYGLQDDALARAAYIKEMDAHLAALAQDIAGMEERINLATLPPEAPLPMAGHANAIKMLRDSGDRAGLAKVLDLLIDEVKISLDPLAGHLTVRIELKRPDRKASERRVNRESWCIIRHLRLLVLAKRRYNFQPV